MSRTTAGLLLASAAFLLLCKLATCEDVAAVVRAGGAGVARSHEPR